MMPARRPPRPSIAAAARVSSDGIGLALVTLLAFWARWHGIAADPLWFDELLTWRRAIQPPAGLVADAFSG
jgi:hypothetical protein